MPRSRREWRGLHRAWRSSRGDRACPTAPGLPDLVFTANAAVGSTAPCCWRAFAIRTANAKRAFEAAFAPCKRTAIDAVRRLPEGLVLEAPGDACSTAPATVWMG